VKLYAPVICVTYAINASELLLESNKSLWIQKVLDELQKMFHVTKELESGLRSHYKHE